VGLTTLSVDKRGAHDTLLLCKRGAHDTCYANYVNCSDVMLSGAHDIGLLLGKRGALSRLKEQG